MRDPVATKGPQEEFPHEVQLTLFGHLKELQRRLLLCLYAYVICAVICYIGSDTIYQFLMAPLPPEVVQKNRNLFHPFALKMNLSLCGGLLLFLPVLTWHIYAFLRPALKRKEGHFIQAFITCSWLLLLISLAFTYAAMRYIVASMLSFTPAGVINEAEIYPYAMDLLAIYTGFALLFQVPLLVFLTVYQDFVPAAFYWRHRRFGIVIMLTLSAIFTPPDVLSQVVVFVPIYMLFELAVLLGHLLAERR